ncbi:MAG: hypothetical protein KC645_15095 [Gemmatimonadetes bacterium]|nr:hypothetical protein [Gemmatimonadota bacterium]
MHRRLRFRPAFLGFALPAILGACGDAVPPPAPGDPLPGLESGALEAFQAGRALFDRDFTEVEGLGPLFNQRRCSSCHDVPTLGGSGVEAVRKATRWEDDRCDLLRAQGGDNLQARATAALSAHGILREDRPAEATAAVDLAAPALYGLGLVDRIPEAALLAGEDPEDANGDGIRGRAARDAAGRVLRFGRKGDAPDLRGFIAGALIEEMGLTTAEHPAERGPNGAALPDGVDPAPDPEVPDASLDLLVAYVSGLAPVAPERLETRAAADTVRAGEAVFEAIGCASCHRPELQTGPDPDPVWDERPVRLYSDLLLHDLGPERAGICGADAGPSEVRTAPLMGLRLRPSLLHDASTQRLEGALTVHGGEAANARARFLTLDPERRSALLRFLSTL